MCNTGGMAVLKQGRATAISGNNLGKLQIAGRIEPDQMGSIKGRKIHQTRVVCGPGNLFPLVTRGPGWVW
jgi:hypothetical protein